RGRLVFREEPVTVLVGGLEAGGGLRLRFCAAGLGGGTQLFLSDQAVVVGVDLGEQFVDARLRGGSGFVFRHRAVVIGVELADPATLTVRPSRWRRGDGVGREQRRGRER